MTATQPYIDKLIPRGAYFRTPAWRSTLLLLGIPLPALTAAGVRDQLSALAPAELASPTVSASYAALVAQLLPTVAVHMKQAMFLTSPFTFTDDSGPNTQQRVRFAICVNVGPGQYVWFPIPVSAGGTNGWDNLRNFPAVPGIDVLPLGDGDRYARDLVYGSPNTNWALTGEGVCTPDQVGWWLRQRGAGTTTLTYGALENEGPTTLALWGGWTGVVPSGWIAVEVGTGLVIYDPLARETELNLTGAGGVSVQTDDAGALRPSADEWQAKIERWSTDVTVSLTFRIAIGVNEHTIVIDRDAATSITLTVDGGIPAVILNVPQNATLFVAVNASNEVTITYSAEVGPGESYLYDTGVREPLGVGVPLTAFPHIELLHNGAPGSTTFARIASSVGTYS